MLPEQMKIAVSEFRDTREGLDRDIWKIDKLRISEERLNKSASLSILIFTI